MSFIFILYSQPGSWGSKAAKEVSRQYGYGAPGAPCCSMLGGGLGEAERGRGIEKRTCVSSDSRWRCIRVRLIGVVVAVVIPTGWVIRQDVQFIHLGARVHHHQLVLGDVSCCRRQVGNGLWLNTLEVHMPTFTLFFFPGHADEGPLDVVVNDLWTTSWSFFDFLFICRIAYEGTV